MTRLRYVLYATFVFAIFMLGMHIFYTRSYIVHIVQSLNIDWKHDRSYELHDGKPINPHGNEIPQDGKIIEVEPEEITKKQISTKDKENTDQADKNEVSKEEKKDNKQIEATKPVDSKTSTIKKETSTVSKDGLNLCSKRGENLVGALLVDKTVPDLEAVNKEYSILHGGVVEKGGLWKPKNCKARVKSAIIIPYRKREEQLKIFLKHMHPILQRQQLHYRIFVVEQADDDTFNRAGLFNIGFVEALKTGQFDCFIFSDVDLLPEDDRNYYGCPTSPRHMSVAIDKFDYRLPYEGIFGGVGAFKREHFESINGFSNKFWGWGGEDDDLYARIRAKGFTLTRPSMAIGRYTMVMAHHFQSHGADPNRMTLLQNSAQRMPVDGLSTLKYKLNKKLELPLVTIFNVKLSKLLYT